MNTDERRCERINDLETINELTRRVIGCAMTVSNTLGCGFLEKVYENALAHELRKSGIACETQCRLNVFYDGAVVGDYTVDILVENELILELKIAKQIDSTHYAQTINYLRAMNRHIGLILNFGNPKLEFKRLGHQL